MKLTTTVQTWVINGLTLSISMTNLENGLKIALLLVTIGYTIAKWTKIKEDEEN
jgi:phosphatidylglycerophosphate synthase